SHPARRNRRNRIIPTKLQKRTILSRHRNPSHQPHYQRTTRRIKLRHRTCVLRPQSVHTHHACDRSHPHRRDSRRSSLQNLSETPTRHRRNPHRHPQQPLHPHRRHTQEPIHHQPATTLSNQRKIGRAHV